MADGSTGYMESLEKRKGDSLSFAIAPKCQYVWLNNQKVKFKGTSFKWKKLKYHGLDGKALVRGEYNMVPVKMLSDAFGGTCVETEGKAYITMPDGKILQFARGCIGYTVDNRIRTMFCEAVERENILYISAEWFCIDVCGLQVSKCNEMMYATDHYARLSVHMTRLIRDILQK